MATFFGCSALKRKCRNLIDFEADGQEITYIHLDGDKELIRERMNKRGAFHESSNDRLPVQDLEKLQSDEMRITVNVKPGLKGCRRILDEINV